MNTGATAKKLAGIAAALGGAALVWCAAGSGALAQEDFRTELEVDIGKFAGEWHELGRTPNWFQDATQKESGKVYSACYNAKAEYRVIGPQKLRIRNTCLRSSGRGDVMRDSIRGVAQVEGGSGNRKLEIALGEGLSRDIQQLATGGGKDYWIYCLGPVNENGRYDWAVVGGAERDFIFLLTREKTVSEQTKNEMLSCARREGLPVNELMYRQR